MAKRKPSAPAGDNSQLLQSWLDLAFEAYTIAPGDRKWELDVASRLREPTRSLVLVCMSAKVDPAYLVDGLAAAENGDAAGVRRAAIGVELVVASAFGAKVERKAGGRPRDEKRERVKDKIEGLYLHGTTKRGDIADALKMPGRVEWVGDLMRELRKEGRIE